MVYMSAVVRIDKDKLVKTISKEVCISCGLGPAAYVNDPVALSGMGMLTRSNKGLALLRWEPMEGWHVRVDNRREPGVCNSIWSMLYQIKFAEINFKARVTGPVGKNQYTAYIFGFEKIHGLYKLASWAIVVRPDGTVVLESWENNVNRVQELNIDPTIYHQYYIKWDGGKVTVVVDNAISTEVEAPSDYMGWFVEVCGRDIPPDQFTDNMTVDIRRFAMKPVYASFAGE